MSATTQANPAPKLKRTWPGRYYGLGRSHSYAVTRDVDGAWVLRIAPTIVVAGVQVTDLSATWTRVHESAHHHLATARAVARAFEQLGDDYRPHEHGHRERHTEAIMRGYAQETEES